jgi:hypothetical protein
MVDGCLMMLTNVRAHSERRLTGYASYYAADRKWQTVWVR